MRSLGVGSSRRLRPVIGCIAALVIACGLAACASSGGGSASGSSSSKTYNMLAMLALSGPDAANGKDIEIGLKAALKQVNSSGGIDGKKVNLTIQDDQGDPNMAVTLVQAALTSANKPDLVTVAAPQEAVPVEAILAKAKVLMIAIGAAEQLADTAKYPLFFATAIDAIDIQAANIAYAKKQGYTKIGFLTGTDGLGQSSETAFKTAAQGSGVSVTYATFDPTSSNVTPQLQSLQAAKPQAVFYDALGTPAGVILQDRHQLGWTVPFIGDSAVAVSNNYAFVPHDALTGALIQYSTLDVANAPGKSPAYPEAYKSFTSMATLNDPLAATGYGYDVLTIAQVGAKQARSTDPTAIAKALETMKTPASVPWISKNGPLGFSATNHTVHYTLKDFTYAPIGPVKEGLIQASGG